jgi:membrane protease YdiL (CAAX protease family)
MICPHCNKEIPDTAVRCKFCRRGVKEALTSFPETILRSAKDLFFGGRDAMACPWSLLDVVLIAELIYIFIFNDPLALGRHLIDFLRLNFFIFTKEPKLLYYLNIYINTIILNGVSFLLVVLFVKLRRSSFWGTVVFGRKSDLPWIKWLPPYIAVCVAFRIINMSNPLIPNIPLNSVFMDALVLGNAVIILTTLFVAPFVEEILFRGFIYPALNKYMGVAPSIILTSTLFTLSHYPHIKEDYLFMAVIFALSVMMTYAKAKTGSTWVAIVMHHVYNLVCVGIGFINYIILKY